jgi:phenylacetate-coenzyme A ligase PaaK-like adenylate-forming protein
VRPGTRPKVALQIEATSEPPVWSALDGRDLATWAGAVSRLWARFGLGRGDSIAFFDYGSNPCVLLSSSIYVPHLRRGAATRLGAEVICNDGVASMTARLLVILEAVRPAALLVRRDLVAPLADALGTRGLPQGSRLRWAAIGEVEGAATTADAERLERVLGVPVRRMLRADAAYLASGDCTRCGLFHLDRAYRAEGLGDGTVAVSARFAQACPAIRYRMGPAEVVGRGCPDEPQAARLAWG